MGIEQNNIGLENQEEVTFFQKIKNIIFPGKPILTEAEQKEADRVAHERRKQKTKTPSPAIHNINIGV